MLTIVIEKKEHFDESRGVFLQIEGATLKLEHSLVSLSKWEARWKKPFLSKTEKNPDELIDYIRCMTITQNVNPNVYFGISEDDYQRVVNYIQDEQSATIVSDQEPRKVNREIITSEIIYYWMIALQIPVEFQKWHLNRLLTLINVCNIKNTPKKKGRSKQTINQERMDRHRIISERRAKFGTKG